MKHILALFLALCCWLSAFADKKTEPVVVAYVTSWTKVMPDPTVMTHLNYAFGHVNDQFNGVRIDNEQRLRDIVALKKHQSKLRVVLSIGGWGSSRFSEMAADEANRKAFALDCRRVCKEFGLDGIDIDWEYPTQKSAGISASPQDTENFTLLMRDLREALGKKLWLSLASVGSAQYIDFQSCVQYLDMVNVMAYDMGNAPKHHSALYRSRIVGWLCTSEAVEAHRKAGVPDDKIVVGMPFYGRGESGVYMKYTDREKQTLRERWNDMAKSPYLEDEDGELAIGFENPRSIAAKCAYIRQQNLRGAMYWEYADDNEQGDLQRAVWQGIMQTNKNRTKSCQKAAKRLIAVLADNRKREDITPDSFFYDWRQLKKEMLAEKDPTSQAIYRAAMAHLLCNNSWRSQRYRRDTPSHPDSIQEWSRQEYYAHAADLYAQALSDGDALHACKAADMRDLVQKGKDDAIFGGDLLYVIWQAAAYDIEKDVREEHLVPDYGDIIDVYRRNGLREATLQLRLDSLSQTYASKDVLLRLRDEYADLPGCAQIYLRLASSSYYNTYEQQDLLVEALQRYPMSREANELRNRLAMLRKPQLSAQFRNMYYPDTYYNIPLEIKNMQTGSITVYRMPKDFAFSDEKDAGTRLQQVQRSGTLVETLPIDVASEDPIELRDDTIRWRTPGFGRYAFVLEGTTKERLDASLEPQITLTNVSALTFMSVTLPDNKVRVMVTDVLSGEPQKDVKATFYRHEENEYIRLEEKITDSRGIAEIEVKDRDFIYVKLSRGEDNVHEVESLGWHYSQNYSDNLSHHLNIYTDRSIYRPGQMVYVGGIAYTQSHDQEPEVEAGAECTLTLYDANGQKVESHELCTDDYGTLRDSLLLPKSGLPGRYTIQTNNSSISIRVEEYRRPTFQVKMDEAPAVSLPADSVTLTGRALTYSQWPVANARVTGTYRWEPCWWWYGDHSYNNPKSIDTLYTDTDGRFSVRIPIDRTKEQLRWGQTLRLTVDVLSQESETQLGSSYVWLCSTPLRMRGDVPEQQCRDLLKPWHFDLYSSNNKEVNGDVLCMLTQDGKEVKNFYLPAGKDTIPDILHNLPSGKYVLNAKAGGKWSKVEGQWSEGDTAVFKTSFTIFSITDKRLLGKHDLWLYAPSDTMSSERPARFQVGTSLSDAWIYCIMNGEDCVVRDTLLHLSDSAVCFEVPYEEQFRHHLNVTVMLMKGGDSYTRSKNFKLELPDTRLRMRWDTFRDNLHPGQHERWRLTLTRPDGTPASANVMVGMYDASLDALASYGMYLGVSRTCGRKVSLSMTNFYNFVRSRYSSLNPSLYIYPAQYYDFARWNDMLFFGINVAKVNGDDRVRVLEREVVFESVDHRLMTKAAPMAAAADVALQSQIAGLDIVNSSADLGEGAMRLRGTGDEEEESADADVTDDAYVRSNLSELAFFYPQLRTDSKGQTSIEFTLPESLTSWHLHGVAHTTDMMTAMWQETVVARKEVMAELTLPRFLRSGDDATLTASVRNASEKRQKGEAVLNVYDAETNKSIKQMKVKFDIEPGKEAVYKMSLTASVDHPVLAVRWIAKGKDSSDGEVRYLPVLSDMQNVTETRTYMLRGDTTLTMDLSKLFANGNPKAVGKTLTVEHVAQPIYLALQALPSLTAPTRSDVLSVATAFYGGSVAYHIAHKYPELRAAVKSWAEEESAEKTGSKSLSANEQLADILVNETPWVVEAQQQKASLQRLATLFDEMDQDQRRMAMLSVLSARQNSDGSFSWFPGMRGSVYMTTEVAMLLVRLGAIQGVLPVPERQVLDRAMSFLVKDMHEDVKLLRKEKKATLSFSQLRYLYIYLMYKDISPASSLSKEDKADADYLVSLLKKQSEDYDRVDRALAAVVLKKSGEEKKAQSLMPRIHELLRHADGMYLAYPGGSFVSIDRKVETHVNMMEAVHTVEPKETELLARMAEWLIRQKRTQEWEQPIQSADAVYALTFTNASLKDENAGTWSGAVTYGSLTQKMAGGEVVPYVRERIEIPQKAAGGSTKQLRIEQKTGTQSGKAAGAGLSWGAVYAQYQLPAAEAENNREGMTIRREVSPVQLSQGNDQWSIVNGQCHTGDRVHVRYTITADRDYEYVCLRAPRPAAAEPVRQLSGYHWQNGIGYYQAMHDASTEFFMDKLPRGTYVIEEDWLMSRDGNYLLPPARLTCLYAPEYQSQTAGEKIPVK